MPAKINFGKIAGKLLNSNCSFRFDTISIAHVHCFTSNVPPSNVVRFLGWGNACKLASFIHWIPQRWWSLSVHVNIYSISNYRKTYFAVQNWRIGQLEFEMLRFQNGLENHNLMFLIYSMKYVEYQWFYKCFACQRC